MENSDPYLQESHLSHHIDHEAHEKKLDEDFNAGLDESLENDLTMETIGENKIHWSENLPPEIVILIFKYLDCSSLTRVSMSNTFWYSLFNSKDIQKVFKNECSDLFDKSGLYTASKKYLLQFQDWKHMFIYRPRIRCDGVYISEVSYWHDGLTEFGDYHPLHRVTYYMFLHFQPDGRVVYAQSPMQPEKVLEKLERKKVPFDEGSYYIKNRVLHVELHKGKYTYYHNYEFLGKMHQHSDAFLLKSKHCLNVEAQSFMNIKLGHGKATFEFSKCKFNFFK